MLYEGYQKHCCTYQQLQINCFCFKIEYKLQNFHLDTLDTKSKSFDIDGTSLSSATMLLITHTGALHSHKRDILSSWCNEQNGNSLIWPSISIKMKNISTSCRLLLIIILCTFCHLFLRTVMGRLHLVA